MKKLLSTTLALLISIQSLYGATLVNGGNINWNGAWKTTSKVDALHASTNLGVDSAGFYQSTAWDGSSSNTDIGVMVWINSVELAGGTFTAALQQDPNDDGTWTDVVTLSTATVALTSASNTPSWYYFKYTVSHTETNGTANYRIEARNTGNTSNEVLVRANAASATNVAVIQVLDATASVAATDVTYIIGIAQSGTVEVTTVTYNVSMNGTAYGNVSIENGGVITFSTTTSTYLEVDGETNVRIGAQWLQGTSEWPIPITSSSTYEFNTTSADRQFTIWDGSTVSFHGGDKFGTDSNFRCTTTDNIAAVGDRTVQTSIDVSAEGWVAGDEVMISGTSSTPGQTEVKTISAVGTSSFTITANWTSTHLSGAEVVNLNRNVWITRSGTNETRIWIDVATADFNWVRFNDLYAVGNLDYNMVMTYYTQSGVNPLQLEPRNVIDFDNSVFYACDSDYGIIYRALNPSVISDWENLAIWGNNLGNSFTYINGALAQTHQITLTNVSAGFLGMSLFYGSNPVGPFGTMTLNNLHFYDRPNNTTTFSALQLAFSGILILNNCKIWGQRSTTGLGYAINMPTTYNATYFGTVELHNSILGGDGTNTLDNGNGDINVVWGADIKSYDTQFLSSTEFSTFSPGAQKVNQKLARFKSHNHDGTDGRYKAFYPNGLITDNTTTSLTDQSGSGVCMVMTPDESTPNDYYLEYEFQIPVTAATDPQLKFYVKKDGGTPTLNMDIFDSDDDLTKLVDNASITLTTDWAQYSAASISPTNTGYCRVVLRALGDATPTEIIGLDTLTYVLDGVTYTVDFERWKDALPDMAGEGAGTGSGGGGATMMITVEE